MSKKTRWLGLFIFGFLLCAFTIILLVYKDREDNKDATSSEITTGTLKFVFQYYDEEEKVYYEAARLGFDEDILLFKIREPDFERYQPKAQRLPESTWYENYTVTDRTDLFFEYSTFADAKDKETGELIEDYSTMDEKKFYLMGDSGLELDGKFLKKEYLNYKNMKVYELGALQGYEYKENHSMDGFAVMIIVLYVLMAAFIIYILYFIAVELKKNYKKKSRQMEKEYIEKQKEE